MNRRLLQAQSNASSTSCVDGGVLQFTFTQSPGTSQIIAGPDFVCRAGVNDVFFDVGTYAAESFSPTVSNAFTTSVFVLPGEVKYFILVDFEAPMIARSYSLISTLEIMFIDTGLNEVSGNATVSLSCTNTSVFLHPTLPFTAISTPSSRAYAPPFYLYVAGWQLHQSLLTVALTAANSSVPMYSSSTVTLLLNYSCVPGQRYALTSYADLYTQLQSQKNSRENTSALALDSASFNCARCSNGSISSVYDAQTCR
jgi:hypothetical protein